MKESLGPTEKDALLSRVDDGGDGEQELLLDETIAAEDAPPVGHRKARSVDLGENALGDRQAELRNMGTRHRKHMSSISEMISHLEPVREDFEGTARAMGRSFRRRLESMDRGETGFFDMSVTRSLSVLPDDLDELIQEVGVAVSAAETPIGAANPPLFQYMALLLAVTVVSSNSTALHMLDGVSAPLKLYWRMTASYLALAPLAIHSLYIDGLPRLSFSGWVTFAAAAMTYSAQGCFFVSALDYTTIGNVVIYANSQALLLIIGKAFVGERIHTFEALGVVIAFSGAILCSIDSEGEAQEEHESTLTIFGDLLAMASAVGGVAYLTFANTVRSEMSVTVFIFSVMFFGSSMILAYLVMTDGENLEFSMNPYIGVFGWLDMTNGRLPILVYLAVVVNMLGTMGFVRAMHYFDTVIIAVATLMEPLMASMIAYMFHAGLLPGPMGWFGNLLVVAGTLGVVYPSIGKAGANEMH
jgi:drug/metabolite transporter (DMT)-like permease